MEQNMNMGTPTPETKSSAGPVISIIVIVLVLAFGAFYFLRQVPLTSDTITPTETQADQAITSLSTQGTSTDITDIEKDLNSTDLNGLDAGLGNIAI